MKKFLCCVVLITSQLLVLGQGRILWNEAVDGRLSATPDAPTLLGSLSYGTNSIFGRVEATPSQFGWTGTNDFFTFNIPAGSQVGAVYLTVSQQILAWLGTADFGTEIGHRYTATSENLIPFFGGLPLSSGAFGMYTYDNDLQSFPTSVDYRLDFVVSTVPEPSTWALLALGGAACWCTTRRRRK